MASDSCAGSSPVCGTNINNNLKFNKIMNLIDIRNKIARNAYSTSDIDFEEKKIIFYYNCKDNAFLALIEASELSDKIIYEKVYTWKEQYKLTIYF